MLFIAAHFTEILVVGSNGVLSIVTYLIVPEEKHPHVVRKARHHVGRFFRSIRPGRSSSVGRHRAVRI